MKNKKDKEEYSPKDQSNSTPIDTSQSEPTKMLKSTNPSQNNSSKTKSPESEDSDLYIFCFMSHFFILYFYASDLIGVNSFFIMVNEI